MEIKKYFCSRESHSAKFTRRRNRGENYEKVPNNRKCRGQSLELNGNMTGWGSEKPFENKYFEEKRGVSYHVRFILLTISQREINQPPRRGREQGCKARRNMWRNKITIFVLIAMFGSLKLIFQYLRNSSTQRTVHFFYNKKHFASRKFLKCEKISLWTSEAVIGMRQYKY